MSVYTWRMVLLRALIRFSLAPLSLGRGLAIAGAVAGTLIFPLTSQAQETATRDTVRQDTGPPDTALQDIEKALRSKAAEEARLKKEAEA
ncbi:MAG: hypothetical protein AAFY04_01910, partial [Pseudomonadota bacterium]